MHATMQTEREEPEQEGRFMKIRGNTLWRVPVFCILASVVCYYLTIYLGGMFYAVKTVDADGTIQASIDPFPCHDI